MEARYKFLILEGPSRVGKTCWARQLAAPGRTLELNCCSGSSPNLKSFKALHHEVVILDEATPQLILNERKLFQAGPTPVILGGSSTNVYSYSVFVHRVKFVVCSNVWSDLVEREIPDTQQWLKDNSVYYKVTTPLWVVA